MYVSLKTAFLSLLVFSLSFFTPVPACNAVGQTVSKPIRSVGNTPSMAAANGIVDASHNRESEKTTLDELRRCAAAGVSQCARQLALGYEGIPSGLSTPVGQDFILAYIWHAISLPGLRDEEKSALRKELEKRQSALTDMELATINTVLASWPDSLPPVRLGAEAAEEETPETPQPPTPEQIEVLHQKAGEDDPDAMRELADCLISGRGMARDLHAAEILLKKASKLGNRDAERELGLMYLHAQAESRNGAPGGDESKQLGLAVLGKLAQKGDTASALSLLNFYMAKDNTPDNREQALLWGLKAAEAGSVPAMVSLAGIFGEQGKKQEETYWLERAALSGNMDALNNLIEQARLDRNARDSGKWLMVLALGDSPEQRFRARKMLLDIHEHWAQKDTENLRQGMQEGEGWFLARLFQQYFPKS